jgi:hypothetical protein
MVKQRRADAQAGVVGIDKESANFGRIAFRIELARIALEVSIAAKKRVSLAPTAAANETAIAFNSEIRFISDELRIDPKCSFEGGFNLL